MATLQAADIGDLVTTTLRDLGKMKFTDIISSYQQTVALKRLMRKNKTIFDSGYELQFNLMTDHNNSARFVGLAEQDNVDITNQMTTGTVPWRHITWNWALDRREPAFNRSPAKIVDLIRTRRIAAFAAAVIKFEYAFWRTPGSTDTVSCYGIPTWIVKSSTAVTTNDGFNGGDPSGITSVGGVSTTTYPKFKNYATTYTTVSKDDLIRKMRRMAVYTDFTPIVDDIPTYNVGDDLSYWTNYSVLGTLEEILEAQNENLGSDIASMDGKTMFRRSPIGFAKELDLDTTNPIYQINFGELQTVGLRGEWMNETQIPVQPGQHTVSATHTDCSFNLICRNRRRQGVLATATTMGY